MEYEFTFLALGLEYFVLALDHPMAISSMFRCCVEDNNNSPSASLVEMMLTQI